MALIIKITDAGRAALINAQNSGTAPVIISAVGVSAQAIAPGSGTVALPGEIKRIATISGDVVSDDTIHVTVRDESADQYTIRSFALYLGDGTLFAAYGQADPIMEKSAQSLLLLAIDVRFVDIDAPDLAFGDANFLNPPATVDRQGVIELATDAEATAGTDAVRAVTPKGMKAAVVKWLDDRFGAGAPSAFIKSLLLSASAVAFRASLSIKSAALKDEGAGNGLDADLLDGQHGAWYADIPARLGYTPWHLNNDGAGSGLDADLVRGVAPSAFGLARLADTGAAAARIGLEISAANTPSTATGGIAATNVQAALAELDTKKAALAGAVFTGNVSVTGSVGAAANIRLAADGNTLGGVDLHRATNNGYVSITNAGGVRQGLIGSLSGTRLRLIAEGAATGWAVTGDMTISADLSIAGDVIPGDVRAKGMVRATGWYGADSADPNGLGVEMGISGGTGFIYVDNRNTGTYADLGFRATSYTFNDGGGTTRATLTTSGLAVTGASSATAGLRATGPSGASNGNGIEIDFAAGAGRVFAYNRTAGSYLPLRVEASQISFGVNGTDIVGVTPTGVDVAGAFSATGPISRAGNTVWDAGNDGAGSGLDADLLDGQQASAFAAAVHAHGAADIAGAFTGSMGLSGYVKLPNGLIIQWGRFTASANGSTTVFFPIVFPTLCFSVAASGGSSGTTDAKDNPPVLLANTITTDRFQVFTADDLTGNCAFIAIGY